MDWIRASSDASLFLLRDALLCWHDCESISQHLNAILSVHFFNSIPCLFYVEGLWGWSSYAQYEDSGSIKIVSSVIIVQFRFHRREVIQKIQYRTCSSGFCSFHCYLWGFGLSYLIASRSGMGIASSRFMWI